MRLLGRLLVFLIAFAVLGGGALALRPVLGDLLAPARELASDQESESVAYALETDRWTAFPFSNPPRRIRLTSHAELPPEAVGTPDEEWTYALEYEVRSATGATIGRGALHLTARLPVFRDPSSGETIPAVTYAQRELVPSAYDATVLELALVEGAAELRVRIAELGRGVAGAGIRVYERRPVRAGQAAVEWQRLESGDRARLARGNVYPVRLLTREEREALVRNAWSPIGPSGVEGRDYRSVTLVTRSDGVLGERVRGTERQVGVAIGPGRNITVPLPEGENLVRLAVGTDAPEGGRITASWFGRGPGARQVLSFEVKAESGTIETEFQGGLLELSADVLMGVEVFVPGPDGEPRELTAELGTQRVYRVASGQDLRYPIAGLPDERTPFRLVVRCTCAGDERRELRLTVAGGDGILVRNVITLSPVASRYDRLVDSPDEPLSEPLELFMGLPPEATELRLSADEPVLVSGFNRPPDLAREFIIPEDYYAAKKDEATGPTWFPLRPSGWEARVAAGSAPLLVASPRPPEDDPELLAGTYDWEQFVPDGDWIARDVLLPREPGPVLRPQALASSYVPLPVGEPVTLEFATPTGGETAAPQLIYLRSEPGTGKIEVTVDGEPVLTAPVTAMRGTMRLPELSAGVHRVEVRAPDATRILVNHVSNLPASALRRSAIRLPEGEITFTIEKRSDASELVVAQVIPQAEAPGRQEIQLRIDLPERSTGPFDSWTLSERHYSLRLGPEQPEIPVFGAEQVVGPARSILIPLGSDLPPGRYPLTIALPEGPEVYLVLSRTVPGLVAQRTVQQE